MQYLYSLGFIREYTYNLYNLYNSQMIFFNLLPIYPLDGGKILSLILYKFFSYYTANIIVIIVSFLIILFIVFLNIYDCNYSNIMVMGFIFCCLYKFFINRKHLYNRFLLERYLYDIKYSRIKIINNIKKMFKNKSHIFISNNNYILEKEF